MLKGGRRSADAPFRTCQVQKTGYFFFAAFFFVAFFFAAFFLAAIRGSPPPHSLLGSCSPNYRAGDGARCVPSRGNNPSTVRATS